MIQITNLHFAYGENEIFRNFNWDFPEGEVTCIVGPSGCGKTTLLKLISQQLSREGKSLATVFQENRLLEDYSVEGNLKLVMGRENRELRIREALAAIGLAGTEHQKISALSGGMKRRVAILRALLSPGEILLMDEPFKELDPDSRELSVDCVKRERCGRTLLLVSHEKEDGRKLSDTAAYLFLQEEKNLL